MESYKRALDIRPPAAIIERSGTTFVGGVGERVPPGAADLSGAPRVGFDHAAVPQAAVGRSRVAVGRVAGDGAMAEEPAVDVGHRGAVPDGQGGQRLVELVDQSAG